MSFEQNLEKEEGSWSYRLSACYSSFSSKGKADSADTFDTTLVLNFLVLMFKFDNLNEHLVLRSVPVMWQTLKLILVSRSFYEEFCVVRCCISQTVTRESLLTKSEFGHNSATEIFYQHSF